MSYLFNHLVNTRSKGKLILLDLALVQQPEGRRRDQRCILLYSFVWLVLVWQWKLYVSAEDFSIACWQPWGSRGNLSSLACCSFLKVAFPPPTKYRVCATPAPNFLSPWGTYNMSSGLGENETCLSDPPPHPLPHFQACLLQIRKDNSGLQVHIVPVITICEQWGGMQSFFFSLKSVSFGSEVDWVGHQA